MVFGRPAELLRHHIEIRGLGVLDIRELFGVTAVRERKRLDLVVHLCEWDEREEFDRLGVEDRHHTILDTPVRELRVPVRSGPRHGQHHRDGGAQRASPPRRAPHGARVPRQDRGPPRRRARGRDPDAVAGARRGAAGVEPAGRGRRSRRRRAAPRARPGSPPRGRAGGRTSEREPLPRTRVDAPTRPDGRRRQRPLGRRQVAGAARARGPRVLLRRQPAARSSRRRRSRSASAGR